MADGGGGGGGYSGALSGSTSSSFANQQRFDSTVDNSRGLQFPKWAVPIVLVMVFGIVLVWLIRKE